MKRLRHVEGETGLITDNSKLKTQNSKLTTEDC